MKKIIFLCFIILTTVALADVPNYSDIYVNDFANVFSESQSGELRGLLIGVREQTTAQVVILTVDNVSPMAMSQYAQEVFDKWKIGQSDKDNGLLILYSKDEDKIWVTTGYGLGGILPDSKVGRILDETFVIERANGNSANGVILATQSYVSVIYENAEEVKSGNAGYQSSDDGFSIIILLYFIFLIISVISSNRRQHPKCPGCKGRMNISKIEVVYEEKNKFGFRNKHYVVTYHCQKCGKIIVKKMKKDPRRQPPLILFFPMGGRRGGFSGGFGGGGSGGGGAGR